MRSPAASLANAAAWAILIGLIAIAFVMVVILGPFGLFLLGLMILSVCTSFQMRDDKPTWGVEVFKARMASPRPREQHWADAEEKVRVLASLRFYRWCGVALLVAGAAGFIWQLWQ
jgi:hypothetical protein